MYYVVKTMADNPTSIVVFRSQSIKIFYLFFIKYKNILFVKLFTDLTIFGNYMYSLIKIAMHVF